MMLPPNVRRSTMAARSRGSVTVGSTLMLHYMTGPGATSDEHSHPDQAPGATGLVPLGPKMSSTAGRSWRSSSNVRRLLRTRASPAPLHCGPVGQPIAWLAHHRRPEELRRSAASACPWRSESGSPPAPSPTRSANRRRSTSARSSSGRPQAQPDPALRSSLPGPAPCTRAPAPEVTTTSAFSSFETVRAGGTPARIS